MLVELHIEGFRNLAPATLRIHPRFNLLEGNNGQGKTNLLEAIHMLATLRSFRDARVRTMLAWGAERAILRATIEEDGLTRTLGVELSKKGKRVMVDGRVVPRAAEFLGHLSVVVFGPEDLALTKAGPDLRRRFLDRAIFGLWPVYLEESKAYVKALKSRNQLLRQMAHGPVDPTLLDVFDATLANRGARVLWRRLGYLRSFAVSMQKSWAEITASGEPVKLQYRGGEHLPMGPDVTEAELGTFLLARLQEGRMTDLRRHFTGRGPHSDDFAVTLQGRSARLYASQGQHRALALALKIAELERMRAELNRTPVLLLDDVSSELDRARNGHLMRHLDAVGGQVFVTTTDRQWIQVEGATKVWQVAEGRLSEFQPVVQPPDKIEELDGPAEPLGHV